MADIDNGYTRIANEIFDKMALVKLSPTQYRILFVVWRYTYGFQRKTHRLSLSFISVATKCDTRSIQRDIKKMVAMKILTEEFDKQTRVLGFNKHLEEWLTNGETANGYSAKGETTKGTIGETTKGTIGETTKGTIGETAKEERKLKENLKKVDSEFLWSLYPEKQGRDAAMKKLPKLIKQYGKEQMERTIQRYIKSVQQRRKEGFPDLKYVNGSTFFNGRYVDYLDENYKDQPLQAEPRKLNPVILDMKRG